jgi:hypothetical protein
MLGDMRVLEGCAVTCFLILLWASCIPGTNTCLPSFRLIPLKCVVNGGIRPHFRVEKMTVQSLLYC